MPETDTSKPFLAFDVGCLECGESSATLGLFATAEEAHAKCDAAKKAQEADWHGQHDFIVYDLRTLEEVEDTR